MKISVIIPTYNRREQVVAAVASVLQQTRKADEVIVVDDGSTDATEQALLPFAEKIRYLYQDQQGVSAARNFGIRDAQYDWLSFLDSDDLWQPSKLARQCQELQQHAEMSVCYTDEEWRKHGMWKNQSKHHQKKSGWIYSSCLPQCLISPSSVLLHRSVFETVGLFDEQLPACEDYDLWLRVCSRFPVLFIPERLIIKQAGHWQQLSAQPGLDKYRIISLTKILTGGTLNEDDRQRTHKVLAEKIRIYAAGCLKHQRQAEYLWTMAVAKRFNMEIKTGEQC